MPVCLGQPAPSGTGASDPGKYPGVHLMVLLPMLYRSRWRLQSFRHLELWVAAPQEHRHCCQNRQSSAWQRQSRCMHAVVQFRLSLSTPRALERGPPAASQLHSPGTVAAVPAGHSSIVERKRAQTHIAVAGSWNADGRGACIRNAIRKAANACLQCSRCDPNEL